jgi:hypothetical protein
MIEYFGITETLKNNNKSAFLSWFDPHIQKCLLGIFCQLLFEYALLRQQVDHLQIILTQTRHVPSGPLNLLTEVRV